MVRKKGQARIKVKPKEDRTVDGIVFSSQLESQYYLHLKELQQHGEIERFELQPKFILQPGYTLKTGGKVQPIRYIGDFKVFYPDGRELIVDVKGMTTEKFEIKKKMLLYQYPDLDLVLVKYVKKYGGWVTHQEWEKLRKGQ